MFSFKSLAASAAIAVASFGAASGAQASTIFNTACGYVGTFNTTCNGAEANLGLTDTEYGFIGWADNSSGSLTISTYVDPFFSTGQSTADIHFSNFTPTEGFWATLTWGNDVFNFVLSSVGLEVTNVFHTFSEGAPGNQADLVIEWGGLYGGETLSVKLSAVPLPAGGLLLLSALGGLGLVRRRRDKVALA